MVLWTSTGGSSFLVPLVIFLLVFCRSIRADHQSYLTAYGCEGTTLSIECQADSVINIVRANYGRFSITICNPQGNTEWSVNCQSPRTHRVLVERCSGQQNCTVEVTSDIFDDPCPGTGKYIETQYNCGVATSTTTTMRPRPPWFVEQRPPIWFPPVLNTSIPSTPKPQTSSTEVPTTRASPATKMTTPTSTTPSTTTTEVSKEIPTSSTTPVPSTTPHVPSEVPPVQSTKATPPKRPFLTPPSPFNGNPDLTVWCSPTFSRGLYWNWTKSGEVAILTCPGGASGSARRKCLNGEWEGPTDLSECRSAWLSNLESRAKGHDAVLGVSTDLAKVTSSKALYGGDLMTSARLIKTLSRRMMQDAALFPEPQQRQAVVTEFLLASLETGSALLSAGMAGPWGDLSIRERRTAVTELMIGLEEASFLLASVLPTATQAAHFKSHVLASTRAVPADGSSVHFPSLEDGSLDWVFTESVSIPPEAVLENSEGAATRVIFLTFRHLEDLLMPHDEVLGTQPRRNVSRIVNSRVVSASLGHGRHIQLPEPVVLTFSLLRHDNVSNPVCAFWDYTTYAWSDEGCVTLHQNRTHVTCKCDHLTNFAVIMDEANPIVVDEPITPVKVLPYVGCFIAIVFLGCSIVMFSFLRSMTSPKTRVQKHVSFCVLIAEIIFVAGIWRTDIPAACGIVAGALHYSVLAAFVWMFIEGLQIYLLVCGSFDTEALELKWWHYIMAYGSPLIVVCGAAVVDPFSFGTATHCWLRIDNYFVFSLIVPVVVLMVLQVSLMVTAVIRTCRLNQDEAIKTKEMSRMTSSRSWVRNSLGLLVLLALTWSCALLHLQQKNLTTAVAFCVLNILYSVVAFINQCVREQKVGEWCCSSRDRNAWMPAFLQCLLATEKQTYSPNNTGCTQPPGSQSLTQYLPTLCHLGGLKGTSGAPCPHQAGPLLSGAPSMMGSRGSIRGYATGSLRIGSLQQSFQQQQQHMTMPAPATAPTEEDSYKSFSRDSGHGGSEQEDSPRTPWSNRTNTQRYINSNDLKNTYLERMNTLNKLASSPYIEAREGTMPNSYTLHPSNIAIVRSQRANSPWNHTYMEIENGDPVYEDIERGRWAVRRGLNTEVMQVSDLSDEDAKRATPSDASHQSARSYNDAKPLLGRPKDSQFSLSEQRLRDFNAAQMSLDLQHLQNVQNLSKDNLMTVAVLNGEQVVCRLSSPNSPQNLPIIHESNATNGCPAHIVVSRPQFVTSTSQEC